jgi:predicted DNA-binding WGR domain protein
VRLARNWGRIGTSDREIVQDYPSEIEAGQALEGLARVKRRRDYTDL